MNEIWHFKPDYPVYEIVGNELYPVEFINLTYETLLKDYKPDYFIIDDKYLVYYGNEKEGEEKIEELLFILNKVFGELKD